MKLLAAGALLFYFPLPNLAQDAKAVAKKVLPSVVSIETYDAGSGGALGSGFLIRSNIVVTNYHVMRSATAAGVTIVGDKHFHKVAGVVGIDKEHDLVLLLVESQIGVPLRIADLSHVEIGESVYVFGSPEGLEGSVSTGVVSAKGTRRVGTQNLIQITAPISPGSSGGPVVDGHGDVIGVASSSLSSGQNLNFAVPAPYLSVLLANMHSPIALSTLDRHESPEDRAQETPELGEALPEWVEVASTPGAVSYLNSSRIVRTGASIFRVWHKLVFNLGTQEGREFQKNVTEYVRTRIRSSGVSVRYMILTQEVNCAESSYRILEKYNYDVANHLVYSAPFSDQTWESPPPGSVNVRVMDAACGMRERR